MNNTDDIRNTFKRFRRALNESEEKKVDDKRGGIPYSNQDELLQTSTQTAKEQFGADFTNIKTPMFYYKEDGDVTLSGEIPGLNNAKFQFRYKDPSGNGCYFWSDGQIILSDENVKKLSKICGVYKNWKNDLSSSEDIRPSNMRNEDE